MIKLDYSNCIAEFIGKEHGVSRDEIKGLEPKFISAHSAVMSKKEKGVLGFMELPHKINEAKDIMEFAKKTKSKFDNFVVIGIGGSALGNIAMFNALKHPFWNLLPKNERKGFLKLFVPDNVDPDLISGLCDVIDFKRTIFNIISKSGTTAECLANFFILKNILIKKVGIKNWQKNVVITTDIEKGYLRELARRENIKSFVVPGNVGGRFSVLSPVGLVSSAFCGMDIVSLLEGAKETSERCMENISQNPALVYAGLQYLFYKKGKKISVMMPYSNKLYGIADWFRQLWAESLGKKFNNKKEVINIGPTPVKALGVTDQHSQVQLYIEGPYDKVITFLSVDSYKTNVRVPMSKERHYLEGHTLNELIKAEEKGTIMALTKQNRPNCSVIFPEISENTVGQFLYMMELSTAYIGELFEINAFDQPGVELGKVLTYGYMGRSGFEKEKKEIEEFIEKGRNALYVI